MFVYFFKIGLFISLIMTSEQTLDMKEVDMGIAFDAENNIIGPDDLSFKDGEESIKKNDAQNSSISTIPKRQPSKKSKISSKTRLTFSRVTYFTLFVNFVIHLNPFLNSIYIDICNYYHGC